MPLITTHIYDSPDGEDCLKKTAYSARSGFLIGGIVSIYDIVGRTHAAGFGPIMARLAHFTLPAAAMGATFASVGCLIGGLTGQTSPLNHGAAGIAAGIVWGTKMHSIPLAVSSGAFFFLLATWHQALKQDGHYDEVKHNGVGPLKQYGSLGHHERYYVMKKTDLSPPDNY